jgi:hypothetical protein
MSSVRDGQAEQKLSQIGGVEARVTRKPGEEIETIETAGFNRFDEPR